MDRLSRSVGLLAQRIGELMSDTVEQDVEPLVELLRRDDVDIRHMQQAIDYLKRLFSQLPWVELTRFPAWHAAAHLWGFGGG